jgi:hypothetical protein
MTIINPNHKGRNITGAYAYRPLLEPEPSDFAPDSNYWRRRGQGAVAELIGKLGVDAVEDWFDATWPEGADPTWWNIALRAEETLHELSIAKEQKT